MLGDEMMGVGRRSKGPGVHAGCPIPWALLRTRYSVALETPMVSATSPTGSPAVISLRACFTAFDAGARMKFGPSLIPRRRAAARPALIRCGCRLMVKRRGARRPADARARARWWHAGAQGTSSVGTTTRRPIRNWKATSWPAACTPALGSAR